MRISLGAFLLLLLTSELDIIFDWWGLLAMRLVVAGIGLAFAVATMSRSDQDHLRRTGRLPLACVLALGVFIVIQLLPAPFSPNPVWDSARASLGGSMDGHFSVDLNATQDSLFLLVLATAIILLGAAVAMDRERAEWCLFTLAISATLGVVVSLFSGAISSGHKSASLECASIGILLALAACLLVFERYETRRTRQAHAFRLFLSRESACAAALVLCIVPLALTWSDRVPVAVFGGVATFLLLVVIRRSGLGIAGILLLLAAAVTIIVGLVATRSMNAASVVLAFSSAPASTIEIANRMIQDAPLIGTGAGSYKALEGLYRGFSDPPDNGAPTTAARLVVELGRPMALGIFAATTAVVGLLVKGAVTRGRDSVYAMLGASLLVFLVLDTFTDASLSTQTTIVLSSGIVGLGLTQRLSGRTP